MLPQQTERWFKQCDLVVSFIQNNPGSTGQKIAYHTGVAVSRVHQIIMYNQRAFELAMTGFVAVQNHNMKPAWYHPSMTDVPLVKGSGIEVISSTEEQSITDTFRDEEVRKQVLALYRQTKAATISPSTSITKRRRAANGILNGVHLLGNGLQEKKREVSEVNQRLERIEMLLLAPPRRVRTRKVQVEA